MPLGKNAVLKTATAVPLCRFENGTERVYVFYTDKEPVYNVSGSLDSVKIVTLSRRDALNAWRASFFGEHLLIFDGVVLSDGAKYRLIGRSPIFTVRAYPALPTVPPGFKRAADSGIFAVYEKKLEQLTGFGEFSACGKTENGAERFEINLIIPKVVDDWFLKIDYSGDGARLYIDGNKCADSFYTGETWEIGLKRFGFPQKLVLEVDPLCKDAPVYLQSYPEMVNGVACRLDSLSLEAEYSADFSAF